MKRDVSYLAVCLSIGLFSILLSTVAWGAGYHHVANQPEFPLHDALPNPHLTPGALNPKVTQETIKQTICLHHYTDSIRPPSSYTNKLKRENIDQYGYSDHDLKHYEEDHLISLELGGSPNSPKNLWPEPHYVEGGWGSYAKDNLENRLRRLVCNGKISLSTAQHAISSDWIAAYKKYIAATP